SKDEVALAAFDHNLTKLNSIFTQEMSRYRSARQKLEVYGKVYADYNKYPFPMGGCPILNTAIESDDTHPGLKKKVVSAVNSWKKQIIMIVEAGIASKEFEKKNDPEQIALTIIALIEGGIMIAKATGKTGYNRMIAKSLQGFIDGIT